MPQNNRQQPPQQRGWPQSPSTRSSAAPMGQNSRTAGGYSSGIQQHGSPSRMPAQVDDSIQQGQMPQRQGYGNAQRANYGNARSGNNYATTPQSRNNAYSHTAVASKPKWFYILIIVGPIVLLSIGAFLGGWYLSKANISTTVLPAPISVEIDRDTKTIFWADVPTATGYEIIITTVDNAGKEIFIDNKPPTTTENDYEYGKHTVIIQNPTQKYFIRIIATANNGQIKSDYSDTVTTT